MESNEPLLPCPFCGGDAEANLLFQSEQYPEKNHFDVRCMTAGCALELGVGRPYRSEIEARKSWNDRPKYQQGINEGLRMAAKGTALLQRVLDYRNGKGKFDLSGIADREVRYTMEGKKRKRSSTCASEFSRGQFAEQFQRNPFREFVSELASAWNPLSVYVFLWWLAIFILNCFWYSSNSPIRGFSTSVVLLLLGILFPVTLNRTPIRKLMVKCILLISIIQAIACAFVSYSH